MRISPHHTRCGFSFFLREREMKGENQQSVERKFQTENLCIYIDFATNHNN